MKRLVVTICSYRGASLLIVHTPDVMKVFRQSDRRPLRPGSSAWCTTRTQRRGSSQSPWSIIGICEPENQELNQWDRHFSLGGVGGDLLSSASFSQYLDHFKTILLLFLKSLLLAKQCEVPLSEDLLQSASRSDFSEKCLNQKLH